MTVAALGARFADRLVAPLPAGRLAAVRRLVVLYGLVWLVVRAGHWRNLARLSGERWRPVAFAEWIGPMSVGAVTAVVIVGLAAGVGALAGGRWWRPCAPVFAVALLVLTVHGASWGAILHTEQLLVLHALVLACGPSGDGASRTAGWPLRVMTAVTASVYFVSGLAKLRFGGGLAWLDGERLMRLVAHDNVRKRLLDDHYSPLARYVVDQRWLFMIAAVATLVVELGAPLILLFPRLRAPWIAAAWSFHLGVLALMAILFPYQLSLVAFASMLPAERLGALVGPLRHRRRRTALLPSRR